jgi:hypothetical protein
LSHCPFLFVSFQGGNRPTPVPRRTSPVAPQPSNSNNNGGDDEDFFLNLPSVPSGLPDVPSNNPSPHHGPGGGAPPPPPPGVSGSGNPEDSIDFDDLTKRFEELKKKK